MSRRFFAVALAATAVACNEQPRRNADGTPALSWAVQDSMLKMKDSVIAEKTRQLSEQGALLGDAATAARMIADIDKDLAKVRGLKANTKPRATNAAETEGTPAHQLAQVQGKVRALIARLNATEARVARMRKDALAHAEVDSAQVKQLRDYERSIADMRATVERQQAEIVVLTQRVDSLRSANTMLIARTSEMSAREDSVFVAIGSEKDLMKRGILKKEGGTKLMFGRGKTLVAARHLEPEHFQLISKSRDLEISLPDPNKTYRVVTRQDLHYVEPQDPRKGVVKGSLKISDPNAFWGGSKYLILVEQ